MFPIFDSKNIKDMYVVAMVKGENEIKKVKMYKNELGKEKEEEEKAIVIDLQSHLLLIEIQKLDL